MNMPVFNLNRQALIAAMITAAFPLTSQSAVGRVEFAVGSVNALGQDGNARSLAKGGEINNGDTIQTIDGRAQIRFSDGGYISLQPNTEFKVEDYTYNGKADGSEKGFFSLVKGGLRAITGAIGHTNKQAYRVNTPVATIGIRGTEYLAQFNNARLLVKVGNGAVYLVNQAGDIVLYKGQVGEAGDGSKPKYSSDQPIVGSAGPTGGKPQETQQEQQNQQNQNNIFVAGELRTADGSPCAISDTCFSGDLVQLDQLNQLLQGPLANLSQLAALDAGAVYSATNTVVLTNACSFLNSTGSVTTAMYINFMTYDVDLSMLTSLSSGYLAGKFVEGYGYGNAALNPANGTIASFSGTTYTFDSGGSSFGGTGFLSVNAASLNSSNLSKATVNYTFSDGVGSTAGVSANMDGVAFPNSTSVSSE
jgi:hypothetical protein